MTYRLSEELDVTSELEQRFASRIVGEVLIGDDNHLFLVGGAHDPLGFALGRRTVRVESLNFFQENLKRRSEVCAAVGVKFQHLLAPDKQSILPAAFGMLEYAGLGQQYVEAAATPVLYPLQELRPPDAEEAYEPTDTHWSAEGCGVIAELLAVSFGLPNQVIAEGRERLRSSLVRRSEPFFGDLGVKLEPKRSSLGYVRLSAAKPALYQSLTEGNRGTMMLAVPRRRAREHRLIIFGDSFMQIALPELSCFFGEVLLCRSRFYHSEMVEAFRPDFVLTQNAERYLSEVRPDSDAFPFLLYPQMTQRSVRCDASSADALAAALTAGSPRHAKFHAKFTSSL